MVRTICLWFFTIALIWLVCPLASAVEPDSQTEPLFWHTDYSAAWREAAKEQKQLLVFFHNQKPSPMRLAVERRMASDAEVVSKLGDFVLAKLPTGALVKEQGRQIRLLDHGSMAEMHGREGLAIVDLAHQDTNYYGYVVSSFPFMQGKYYQFRADYVPAILDLPPGTITQRTMIWAVRVHPERPASTKGALNTGLMTEAHSHSKYQAQIGVQGHHRWDSRFGRILRFLGGRRTPVEVVAESWPNQTMIDSCIDCVHSWRQSSGHWNAVSSYQSAYGYDIKRGNNGIWYGTGIFAN